MIIKVPSNSLSPSQTSHNRGALFLCHKIRTFLSLTIILLASAWFFAAPISATAQGGPAGVGNTYGTNGQPRLVMWLDATAIDPASGPNLSLWLDMSGNGNHAQVPIMAQRPLLDPSLLNNRAAVRFDAAQQQYFELDGSMITASDLTITYVAARTTDAYNLVLGGTRWGDDNRNLHMGWNTGTGLLSSHHGNDILATATGGAGSGVNNFGIFSNRLQADGAAPARRFYQNGLLTGSVNNRNQLLSYEGAGIARNTGTYYHVDVAEMVFFNEALSEPATRILNTYLSVKYGLALEEGAPLYSNPTYTHQLIGVGTADGLVKHPASSGSGGALFLRQANNTLDEEHEYVLAAHNNTPHGITTLDIAANDIADTRWNRDWYLQRIQGGIEGSGTTDISIGFNFPQAQQPLVEGALYTLLYRDSPTGDFLPVSGLLAMAQGSTVWFMLPHHLFQSGYYTIGRANLSATTWYSYKNGNWEDHTTWTTNPSGTLMEGPSGVVPGMLDKAVILPSNRVTVTTNTKEVQVLEIQQGGVLDLAATTSHTFHTITGQGTLMLSTPQFPQGSYASFAEAGAGTVEYYGTGMEVSTMHTFNNLTINMNQASDTWTLTRDLHLNGNLLVARGNLRINDHEKSTPLTISIDGNLSVAAQGALGVGNGNTAAGFSIPTALPTSGNYHSIFHQVILKGNFTNQGQVRFTNQLAPVYDQFSFSGAVSIIFTGNQNSLVSLMGITDFYNLVVHKGTNQNTVLEINASHSDHFALYGPNNLGAGTESPFSQEHPELRKALWIRSGTLKLTGNITIPSLTEGSISGGAGDYVIGERAALWVDGANVSIHTTIAVVDQMPQNASGFTAASNESGLELYGTLGINAGYFGTRHSAGLRYWPQSHARLIINGGTLEVSMLYTGAGGTGQTYYEQTGGTVLIRGDRGPDGGEMVAGVPMLGLRNPFDVFSMSGGDIRIRHHNNSRGLLIASDTENQQVTGGTVHIELHGGDLFPIETTTRLGNLHIRRLAGTGPVKAYMVSPLRLISDLFIGDHSELHSKNPLIPASTEFDLHIGRHLTMGETPSLNTAKYVNLSNTTWFTGAVSGDINIVNTTTHHVLSMFNWVIHKEDPLATITLNSPGRTPMLTAPYLGPVAITNSLRVLGGKLHYNGFPVQLAFSTFVENHGTIGLMDDPGFLVFQGSSNQQLRIPAKGEPFFGQILIDNISGITLVGKATLNVGSLKMRQGIFDIGNEKLVIHGNLENVVATGSAAFADNKMIRTAGRHTDGGLVRRITTNTQYIYPLGTNRDNKNRYTPARPTFSNVTDEGFVQINNVGQELATLVPYTNNKGALQYYWRMRFQGFVNPPLVSNYFNYIVTDVQNLATNQYRAGKVVNLVRSCCTIGDAYSGTGAAAHYITYLQTTLEEGEFTLAHSDRFQGSVRVYYTRDHGTSTGITAREPRWHDNNSWTRSDITGFDPAQPHRSSNPAAPASPGAGDIVYIGWVPWDDPKTALRGQPHGVWIDNNHQYAAEVHFTQMLDQAGNPTPKYYRSNFQFRPTLCINNLGGQLTTAVVSGEGMFWNRDNSQPNFEVMDIREFAEQDSSYVLYENFRADFFYGFTPPLFPNLMISNDLWGARNNNITFTKNIETSGNFEILGNINLLLNTAETGDFTIGRDMILFEFQGSEGSASGGGAEISFNSTGTPRNFKVGGNLLMRSRGSQIHVRNAAAGNNILHHFEVHGDIIQESGGASPDGLNFFTAATRPRITLTMAGNKDGTFTVVSGTIPNLFNLKVEKGSHSAFLNANFILNASGNAINKPLELVSGTTVLNHPDLNLLVNTGGASFPIPALAALVLQQGQVRVTGSNTGVALQGRMALYNQTTALIESPANNNFIEYGGSGNARLEIYDDALLRVGSQVRSSVVSNQGVLKYRQSGGLVFLATQLVPETTRGVLEIYNAGSEFIFTAGQLTLGNAHGTFPAREPLYLEPAFSSVTPQAVIRVGGANTPENQIIELYSKAPLPSVWVNNATPVRAMATNSLTLIGDLIIGTANSFSGNGNNLTLKRDLHNQGNALLNADTVFFTGATQNVTGTTLFNKLVVDATEEVILAAGNAAWDVQQNMLLFGGVLIDGGNLINLRANVYNHAIHSSTSPLMGGLRLQGSTQQNIYGNGTFGRLELDNAMGARIHGAMRLDNHLTLTQGVFSIAGYRLTMGPQANILGTDFGPQKMIRTNGIFEDRGLRKHVATGSGTFTFPFGANGKFNPAILSWSSNANPGTVDITPVDMAHITFTGEDVLRYYWYVESNSLNNFSGSLTLKYNQSEVEGIDGDYIAARLLDNQWLKFGQEFVDEVNDSIFFHFTGQNQIHGEYTAGLDDEIPENVPLLISNANGTFIDENNWIRLDDKPVPVGGPNGHRILILPQHTITVHDDQRVTYQAEIQGRLELDETIMHNLGTLTGTGTLAISSGVLPAGRLDAFFTCSGGTMEYGGFNDIHISPRFTTFRNLTLTGTGMRALPALGILVCNDLKVLSQANMAATHPITLMGNFTLEATATTNFSSDFIMAGTFLQHVYGDVIGANAFHNLELNNSNGVLFTGSAMVDEMLTLRNGTAFLQGTNFLQINNIYGLSFTPNAQRDNFVQGHLIRLLSSGGGQNIFPVGRNNKMRNLFVSAPSTAGASYWNVIYHDTDATLAGMPTAWYLDPLLMVSNREFWGVEGPENSSAVIGLSWGPESGIDNTNLEGLTVAKWQGSAWKNKGGTLKSPTPVNFGTLFSETTSYFSQQYFTLASSNPNDPLPIELLSFHATPDRATVELTWVTASEINNDFFTIERSRDGITFEPVAYIQSMAPNGLSTHNLYYATTDEQPLEGRSYYRLKQTDFDGSYEYSKMVGVMMTAQRNVAFSLFPNPNRGDQFNIALQGLTPFAEATITITSMAGRVLYHQKTQADHNGGIQQVLSPAGRLQKGVYIVTVMERGMRFNVRMVVQ